MSAPVVVFGIGNRSRGDDAAGPLVVERFAALGTEPVPPAQTTPDALRSQLSAEVQRWDAAIKKAGVKGE